MDDGDFVVVKNVEQAKFTGKKFKDKKYYKHTGHPGGIKEITPEKLLEKNKPGETLKLAVKRMLPGGVLGRKQLTKVKIYAGEEHPHAAQNPKILDLGKLISCLVYNFKWSCNLHFMTSTSEILIHSSAINVNFACTFFHPNFCNRFFSSTSCVFTIFKI